MKKLQIIKEGKKSIFHLPKILSFFLEKKYTQIFTVNTDIFSINDSCDSGWNKLWGISLFYVHYTSYRFVFRIKNHKLLLGYYIYLNGISPQKNKKQKIQSELLFNVGDKIKFTILNKKKDIWMIIHNISQKTEEIQVFRKGKGFIITENYPNVKCRVPHNTYFLFD